VKPPLDIIEQPVEAMGLEVVKVVINAIETRGAETVLGSDSLGNWFYAAAAHHRRRKILLCDWRSNQPCISHFEQLETLSELHFCTDLQVATTAQAF
jgi:hypothetical protein